MKMYIEIEVEVDTDYVPSGPNGWEEHISLIEVRHNDRPIILAPSNLAELKDRVLEEKRGEEDMKVFMQDGSTLLHRTSEEAREDELGIVDRRYVR